jgi:tRNA (adenine58-N1)-methyltransferase non-catalytic subunit
VPAAELHAEVLLEEAEGGDSATPGAQVDEFSLPTDNKSNVNITDDPTNQRLTMAEIEELKQDEMGSAKYLIAKIMQSHTTLDQKTAFSLAKYTLRKHRKYMKRFTVLPLDVATLTDWMMVEKDFTKIMEIRNEVLGLMGCWANVHASGDPLPTPHPTSRYLVVDDTGGLVAAAMAERMGILHQANPSSAPEQPAEEAEEDPPLDEADTTQAPSTETNPSQKPPAPIPMSSTSNTLTIIHSNQQPNLSLLRYFNFDVNNPTPSHPLYTHLRTLSWLQLLDPTSDSLYNEPAVLSPTELAKLKSSRRSNYFRKRRRWERAKAVIDSTREGGFDGLIVASHTSPTSILGKLVPLLRGGAQVVVYAPSIEPLLALTDYYSTARRTAYLNREAELSTTTTTTEDDLGVAPPADASHIPETTSSNHDDPSTTTTTTTDSSNQATSTPTDTPKLTAPNSQFPVDPTLLLGPAVHTTRIRAWQVLPGRTHPVMTSKGGAEGYVWTATRVIRAEGKVSARGKGRRNVKNKVASSKRGEDGVGSGEAVGSKRVRLE